MKPKVSIIVPIYNVEKYLRRCVDSLVNQTLKDIEIILVDDESPDNCPLLCNNLKKANPIFKVVHKKNGGLGYARNSGLEQAKGDFVAFVDSDDFVSLEMYNKLYEFAVANNCDAVFCGYNYYIDDKHIIKKQENEECILYGGETGINRVLFDMVGSEPSYKSDVRILSSVWKGIYRRELIEKNNLRFVSERVYIAEDIIFHIDFIPLCKCIGFVPDCFYYYCDNGTSLTRTLKIDRFDKELFLFETIKQKLLEHGYSLFEFEERLQRYLLLKLRVCIMQFVKNRKVIGDSSLYGIIHKMLNNPEVERLLSTYNFIKLPLKHKLFYLLLKSKKEILIINVLRFAK